MASLAGNQCPKQASLDPAPSGAEFNLARGPGTDVRIVDPLCDPSWDQLVLSHPNHNLFHRAAWAKVLWKTYGHRPIYLRFDGSGGPDGLIPIMEVASPVTGRRGVSIPFSDFCWPLLFDRSAQDPLLQRLLELGRDRKWRYFELRGSKEVLATTTAAAEKYYGHKLDLKREIKELFAGLQSSVRRAIRKAEKSGLIVEVARTRKAMLDFYRLHVRTRRRHGLPPQPLSFFLNIDEEVLKANLGFVVIAKSRTNPIAGAVFFHSGQTALFKFGASDERVHDLRGNNLVMWEGIKQLCEKGLGTLHFGRTSMGNDGLRRFKLSWGTKEETIEYFRFALATNRWLISHRNASEFHSLLLRKLPLAFNRLAGTLIYPHLD